MAQKKAQPKDKKDTKWWQKRNTARKDKQEAHAKMVTDLKVGSE